MACAPTDAPSSTNVRSQSGARTNAARGWRTFVNCAPGPTKTSFPEDDAVPDARVALNADTGTDDRTARDEAKCADDHIGSEHGPIRDDRRWVNARRRAGSKPRVHP